MKTITFSFIAGLILLPNAAIADMKSDVIRCTKISENNERLACFDQVAKYYANKNTNAQPTSKPQIAASTTPQTPTSPPVSTKPASPATQIISGEDAFGKADTEINPIEKIETTIIGEFKGWKKGAILKLKNGQTWKVISRTKGYINIVNPKVVISRGALGSYNMNVEGLNASAKVRRVK